LKERITPLQFIRVSLFSGLWPLPTITKIIRNYSEWRIK
jgi:hypothetical protein